MFSNGATTDYQEDISANPFFKILKRSKLYQNVERNCWLVCVPQAPSITGMKITQDILDVHVLQPSPYFQGEFMTANNKTVTVEDGSITIANDLRDHRTAKILFEETFYTKDNKSFRVLCIDTPLAGEIKVNPATAVQLPSTRSLADISTFLHSFPINSIVLSKVHEQISELEKTYVVVKGFESHAVGKAKALSEKALEDLVCANPDFRYLYEDDRLTNELSLVVESYVVGALYPFLFPSLKNNFAQEDSRIRSNLFEWRTKNIGKELGLKADLIPHIAHITPHLQRMESCHTPLEKLWCVHEGLEAASFAISISRSGESLGADDTLPLLIAAVIEASPPNLHTNLFYIQNFVFAKIDSSALGYQLVNFHAAIQYLRGEDKEGERERDPESESIDTAAHDSHAAAVDWRKSVELLDFLTQGVNESLTFSPNRHTSSTRSPPTTPTSAITSSASTTGYFQPTSTSTYRNSIHFGNTNNNFSTNSSFGTAAGLINSNSYSPHTNFKPEFYRPVKSFDSVSNPLADNFQDWLAPPTKPSSSPPLGSRAVSEFDLRTTPYGSSSSSSASSAFSAASRNSPAFRSTPAFNHSSSLSSSSSSNNSPRGTQPQPQQYKRPPTVIKIDTKPDDGDSGGGFLAQLRKLGDDGVSSSQFRR